MSDMPLEFRGMNKSEMESIHKEALEYSTNNEKKIIMEIEHFANNMQPELIANEQRKGKDGWKRLDKFYLFSEMLSHAEKLFATMGSGDGALIKEYTADIGNLSMMIADVCGVLKQSKMVTTDD